MGGGHLDEPRHLDGGAYEREHLLIKGDDSQIVMRTPTNLNAHYQHSSVTTSHTGITRKQTNENYTTLAV